MVFDSFAESHNLFLWCAFIGAIVMGAVVNKTNFCTMGAVSDMVNIGDHNRFRAWLLAIAIAMLGVTLLEYAGMVDADSTFPPFRGSNLLLAEHLLGGFMFGIGMTFASGCGNKTLIRIGAGNLKSVVVFIIIAVISWYMLFPLPGTDQTLFSLFFYEWIRPLSIGLSSEQDIGAMVNNIAGTDNTDGLRLAFGLLIATTLLITLLRRAEFRANRDNVLSGVVVGLAVVFAWFVSNNIHIEADEELYTLAEYYEEWDLLADSDEGKPAIARTLASQSYTFISPMGQAYGYATSGFDAALVTFGLVALTGLILGSLLWALATRSFRIEWFVDSKDFLNHVIGGVLMGFGGMLAIGCTIGQGVTGLSTLALGSVLTFVSIVFGGALTMKMQYYYLCYEDEASFIKTLLSSLVDMNLLPESLRKLEAL